VKLILIVLIFFSGAYMTESSFIQSKDLWQTLSMVTFVNEYDPDFMMEIKTPKVSPVIEVLNGKEIEIEGYIIPLTGQTKQSHFMLSRYPQSTCFFCGKAGPESAMQVFMKNNIKIQISERKVKVKGTLIVNPKDITSLLYTLENATLSE
jgi:hypothetical protein